VGDQYRPQPRRNFPYPCPLLHLSQNAHLNPRRTVLDPDLRRLEREALSLGLGVIIDVAALLPAVGQHVAFNLRVARLIHPLEVVELLGEHQGFRAGEDDVADLDPLDAAGGDTNQPDLVAFAPTLGDDTE